MDFKIRVVENIGTDSESTFGAVGTILSVVDGTLTDIDDYEWTQLFSDVEEINEYFSDEDSYQTKFELVEE